MKFLVISLVLFALVTQIWCFPKIINGELAVKGQFPHMVQLAIKKNNSTKYCGGSLIDPSWVLTAAHCCQDMMSAKAFLGSIFMRTMPLKLKVVDAAIHPLYKNINAHDIALLKLEKPVEFSELIQPVNLPARHQAATSSFIDSLLSVPGFGLTKNSSQSNLHLRFVRMRAITNEECENEWGWPFKENFVCAQGFDSFNHTTCNGDSGNGLIRKDDSETTIFGIVSYGAPGCVGKPKVFTRVASYLDFIKAVTGMEKKN